MIGEYVWIGFMKAWKVSVRKGGRSIKGKLEIVVAIKDKVVKWIRLIGLMGGGIVINSGSTGRNGDKNRGDGG